MGYEVYFHKSTDKGNVLMSLMRANPNQVYSFRLHGEEVDRGVIVDVAGGNNEILVIGGWNDEENEYDEVNLRFVPLSSFNKVRTVNMEDAK